MKKVLLANNMAIAADVAFSSPASDLGISFAWLGAICYTCKFISIFRDISGYGNRTWKNLPDFIFWKTSIILMWQLLLRIFGEGGIFPLSSWFRDYVYIPLGGNQVGKEETILEFVLCLVADRIWHGGRWTLFCGECTILYGCLLKNLFFRNISDKNWKAVFLDISMCWFLLLLVGLFLERIRFLCT